MANSVTEPLLESGRPDEDPIDNGKKDVLKIEPGACSSWLLAELGMQVRVAGPMICVNLLQYSVNLVSVMFVGHLGELALASASMSTSVAGVTGYSVMFGMGAALDTLCGQAFGAKQYRSVGVYLQRAILILNCVALALACLWWNVTPILRASGQDPEISEYAGQYTRYLLPVLFAYATLQPIDKFLQAQSAVLPMALCSLLTLCLHIFLCWLFVIKLGVGYRGAAIANSISQWLNVSFLVLYIKFGPTCKKTWTGFTKDAFYDLKPFLKLAFSSAIMICLEYWSFELMVLLSGLLPNPQLEMSALAISLNTIALMYMIPFGIAASASVRVSNELGAGRVSAARWASIVAVSLGVAEGLLMSTAAFSARKVWPYIFTNERELVDYVGSLIPFLCLLTIFDSCQAVLSGVIRGCGYQSRGAYANLAAYYIVGVPLAVVLAFHYHLSGRGLWIGMTAALACQASGLALIACFSDWEKKAESARARMLDDRSSTEKLITHKDNAKSPILS